MQHSMDDSMSEVKLVDFGSIPVDTVAQKSVWVENQTDKFLVYRVSLIYVLNTVDHVFKLSVPSTPVKPRDGVEVRICFRPNIPGQAFTEYYIVDDTGGNSYRITVSGKCFGPNVSLSKKQLVFSIYKNVDEKRRAVINIVNKSAVETTYQWLLPLSGQGYFQISTGNCGLIRAYETIPTTIVFTGTALGMYTGELTCLFLHQEPQFLNVVATVVLPGNILYNIQDHVFEKHWKRKNRSAHLMQNSLKRLSYIPSASVYDRYLDFGKGSVTNNTLNISQTICLTNHEQEDGYIQWMPDPDNVFLIDPVVSIIPSSESRLFTIRFRPKLAEEVFGYLLCGDYQQKSYDEDNPDEVKLKHTWFRIPCVGNTWSKCTQWATEWNCPTEVVMPPTVPGRTAFANFMLSNKLETAMYFKFVAPDDTNFVVMPMCGIVQGRGWQIITVALEPKTLGDFYENWNLMINKVYKAPVCLIGNAETSQLEVMSHGYNPATDAVYVFPPTITGCTNYCTAYLHNLTRMNMHIRLLNSASWLGGDSGGSLLIPPKEIVCYHWWFFPKVPDQVYETTVTCSCIVLIDGRPVGEPKEIFIQVTGFSEYPDLRVLPKSLNLNDIVVKDSVSQSITLYNNGSCFYTSKLYHEIDGLEDDFSKDRFKIDSAINSLKPSNFCDVKLTITPDGSGPRQIEIKYTVLFRTEFDEIEEIQPISKTICTIYFDGIYPTIKVKRTISVECPVILSNHCVWNITNVDEFNKVLMDCRPNKPLSANIYGPDLCVHAGPVELIFVLGCVYRVPVSWSLRREKLCDCEMVEVPLGISMFEMRHTCIHRNLVELSPLNGIISPNQPALLHIRFNYAYEGSNTLCYVLTLSNQRSIYLYINMFAHVSTKAILTPLRRIIGQSEYLAVLDCGKVPINNLDPVIRIVWLYNPTDVFTTWRLLRGNTISPDDEVRCLLYFAEVPPLGKLAIPFAFMPTEMVDYEVTFSCSFGYDTVKILVKGQGGLPNCVETRLDVPFYVEKVIRCAYRKEVVFLSVEHYTIPIMPTHSLSRDAIAIYNDTNSVMRFIWLPERIANIVNIVMTPCWGVIQPKCSEWITMTVYTLQEPATFTTTVACEILDLTSRKLFQRNELLRRSKAEKCAQEFIITEEGFFHPNINDEPPYVLEISKPKPFYLSLTVSISSKGQRDGYPRMLMKQMWEQVCNGRNYIKKSTNSYYISGNGNIEYHVINRPPIGSSSVRKCGVKQRCISGLVNVHISSVRLKSRTSIKVSSNYSTSNMFIYCDVDKILTMAELLIYITLKTNCDFRKLIVTHNNTPPYDLLSSELSDTVGPDKSGNMTIADIIRIIDGILWDALHSKMFKYQIQYYSKEEIPTYSRLMSIFEKSVKSKLSRRVTSGICDAIVNKAVFHVYNLSPKHEMNLFEA